MDKNKLAEEYAWRIRHSPIKADVRSRAFIAGFDAADSIANAKIQELEQKLKNCISIDAHLEWKREWEQQLKEAESVIKELDLGMVGNAMALARQYLKSRGE